MHPNFCVASLLNRTLCYVSTIIFSITKPNFVICGYPNIRHLSMLPNWEFVIARTSLTLIFYILSLCTKLRYLKTAEFTITPECTREIYMDNINWGAM